MDISISIPTHGDWENDFTLNVMSMVSHTAKTLPGTITRVNAASSSILIQNRFELVKMAREVGSTHMLMLDDDMTFPPDTLVRLLEAKRDIVAANYIGRKPPHEPLAAANGKRLMSLGKVGLEPADHVGLGVCLVSMKVFEKIAPPYFYFGWAPKDEEFVGEDVWFFRECKKAGFQLWIDHGLSNQIGHIGKFEWTHEVAALLAQLFGSKRSLLTLR